MVALMVLSIVSILSTRSRMTYGRQHRSAVITLSLQMASRRNKMGSADGWVDVRPAQAVPSLHISHQQQHVEERSAWRARCVGEWCERYEGERGRDTAFLLQGLLLKVRNERHCSASETQPVAQTRLPPAPQLRLNGQSTGTAEPRAGQPQEQPHLCFERSLQGRAG